MRYSEVTERNLDRPNCVVRSFWRIEDLGGRVEVSRLSSIAFEDVKTDYEIRLPEDMELVVIDYYVKNFAKQDALDLKRKFENGY